MKIAITTSGISLEAPVDKRFGRAPKMLIYDSDLGTYHVQNNEQNVTAAHGAGVQAAQHLCDEHVGCVITGRCGPKAFKALRAADIAVCTCSACSVAEAIDRFKQGELVPIDCANVEGHWAQ